MYSVIYTQSARRALKRLKHSGSFPEAKFRELLGLFIAGKQLPASFKDHGLQGELPASRECHLSFHLLVIYKRDDTKGTACIEEVGTHPELFGE